MGDTWSQALILAGLGLVLGLVSLYIAWSLRRLADGWDARLDEHRRRIRQIERHLGIDSGSDSQTLPLKPRKNGA